MSSVEVYRGADGWRYRVKGRNGEIVAQSEVYASKQNAIRGVSDLVEVIETAKADTSRTFITVIESFADPSGD